MLKHALIAPYKYYVWSETLPYASLRGRHLQAALEQNNVVPIVAVSPDTLSELPRTLQSLQEAKVRFGLWPKIENRHGRWLSKEYSKQFVEFSNRLIGVCFDKTTVPSLLALDLEPPIENMKNWWKPSFKKKLWKSTMFHSENSFQAFRRELKSADIEVHAAIFPLLALKSDKAKTPDVLNEADCIHTMAYTTLFKGYSKGLITRQDSLRLLKILSQNSCDRFGLSAAMSLGCIGTGSSNNKTVYRDPYQLKQDVALIKATSIRQIAAYDLGGMVKRGPANLWLEALTKTRESNEDYSLNLKTKGLQHLGAVIGKRMNRFMKT